MPALSPLERITLSPWEKFQGHGRFPYKLVVHVVLLALMTSQIIIFNTEDSAYLRNTRRSWARAFLPAQDGDLSDERPRIRYIYEVDELLADLRSSLTTYENLRDVSVDHIEYVEQNRKPIMRFEAFASDAVFKPVSQGYDPSRVSRKLRVTSTDLGEELEDKVHQRSFVRRLLKLSMTYRLSTFSGLTRRNRKCLVWAIDVEYDFTDGGQIAKTASYSVEGNCALNESQEDVLKWEDSQPLLWLNVSIICASCAYLFLLGRSLFRSFVLLVSTEKRFRSRRHGFEALHAPLVVVDAASRDDVDDATAAGVLPPAVSEYQQPSRPSHIIRAASTGSNADADDSRRTPRTLGSSSTATTIRCGDRIKFVNLWFVVSTFACVFAVVSCVMNLSSDSSHTPTSKPHAFVSSSGVALLWISTLGFVSHDKSFYHLALTTRRALPRIAKFLGGVAPLFIAYALFGLAYFGAYVNAFSGFSSSTVLLFSVLNGDIIWQTFDELQRHGSIVASLYLYSFISIFMYVILNLFIALVEECYFSVILSHQEDEFTQASEAAKLEFLRKILSRESRDDEL